MGPVRGYRIASRHFACLVMLAIGFASGVIPAARAA